MLRHAGDRHHAAPRHLLGVTRGLRADKFFANDRVDAVCANYDIRLDGAAVGECRASAGAGGRHVDALGIEHNADIG
jgi:hypothetical protein